MEDLLNQPLKNIVRITKKHEPSLKRLGIFTVKDLLYHFPTRYEDIALHVSINHVLQELHDETTNIKVKRATLYGTIDSLISNKSFSSRMPMTTGRLTDSNGDTIKLTWFNQGYIAKMFESGEMVKVVGDVQLSKKKLVMNNPLVEKSNKLPIDVHDSLFKDTSVQISGIGTPLYRETRGITSRWMYVAITKILSHELFENTPDPIPEHIRNKLNLPSRTTAFVWAHMPQTKEHAESASKRFAFEEIFIIQNKLTQDRLKYRNTTSIQLDKKKSSSSAQTFIDRFPFPLTGAQNRVIGEILNDMSSPNPMSRLLEGDVGSGKTAVAAVASQLIATQQPTNQSFGNIQVAYMAPTEILATQLFESFVEYFEHTGLQVALITGSGCRKFPSKVDPKTWTSVSKSQLTKWIANGEVPIVVGTHALISKKVVFKHLGLVIIDEQHRFGTKQRMGLAQKDGVTPHYLSMSATPIPRTLALTIYGDLDLSIIDEYPAGRKTVITEVTHTKEREALYEKLRAELKSGRQVYVICPRIFDGSKKLSQQEYLDLSAAKKKALQLKSVEAERERLEKDVFPEYRIGALHSKLSKIEKESVMQDFSDHKLDILVATSVIEVGVNVPNATNIIIEGAERYGLAQLHQLRGRVLRSSRQAYCYLFVDSKSDKTLERLEAFLNARDGFELAEYDLKLRGAGHLINGKQWGISDTAMIALSNPRLVTAARDAAQNLIKEDPALENYPLLASYVKNIGGGLHLE